VLVSNDVSNDMKRLKNMKLMKKTTHGEGARAWRGRAQPARGLRPRGHQARRADD